MQARLVTAVALTLLFAACLAVAVTWTRQDPSHSDSAVGANSSTGGPVAPIVGEAPAAQDTSDDSLPDGAWWTAYDTVGGSFPADGDDPASEDDGATSPSLPEGALNPDSGSTPSSSTLTGSTEPPSKQSTSAGPVSTATSAPPTEPPTTATTTAPTTAPPPSLAVFGVEADDVLNVRSGPGSGSSIVAQLSPSEQGVEALGPSQVLSDGTVWFEVRARGTTGWAAARYLFTSGGSRNATSEVVGAAGGTPTAATLADLGRTVAGHLAGSGSRLVMSGGPSGSEVTYDIVGGSGTSTRVRVVAQPADSGGYKLESVTATTYTPS